ncbi:hypothetical protein HYU08_00965, partial [Candidatus Woesearchaeota archaeon]|nr:hypothetical protein [Candidatus Woesearchaeota archaeon]
MKKIFVMISILMMLTLLIACSPAEKVPETTGATEEQPTVITEAVIEESAPPASDNVIK